MNKTCLWTLSCLDPRNKQLQEQFAHTHSGAAYSLSCWVKSYFTSSTSVTGQGKIQTKTTAARKSYVNGTLNIILLSGENNCPLKLRQK